MDTIRLNVRDVGVSSRFYTSLLGREVDGASDRAVFTTGEMRLELTAVPESLRVARQIDIVMGDADQVVSTYERLWDACVRLPQIPTELGFGLGFVALDPDGHRLRVFCLYEAAAA